MKEFLLWLSLTLSSYGQQYEGICQTVHVSSADIMIAARATHGEVVVISRPDRVEFFLQYMNHIPPVTEVHAEGLLIMHVPGIGATVGLRWGDMICKFYTLGETQYQAAIKAAFDDSI